MAVTKTYRATDRGVIKAVNRSMEQRGWQVTLFQEAFSPGAYSYGDNPGDAPFRDQTFVYLSAGRTPGGTAIVRFTEADTYKNYDHPIHRLFYDHTNIIALASSLTEPEAQHLDGVIRAHLDKETSEKRKPVS